MTPIHRQPIVHPAAWKGSDFRSKDDVAFDLGRRHLDAFDAALVGTRRAGLTLERIERAHFQLPEIADELAGLLHTLRHGRGIVLVRGFPVDRYDDEEMAILYWGIGTHLGVGQSQSVLGDRLGHVVDVSATDPNARAYRNKQELTLHTDLAELVGLLCLRQAEEGGFSRYASVLAIHNEILAHHPEHLEPLYRGFPVYRLGEQAEGELPYTPYDVPVFCNVDGTVSTRYIRECIDVGAKLKGTGLTEAERAALDHFDAVANRPDIVFQFRMEAGEACFVNNFTTLHARTAFRDGADPARRRHLLRLWLAVPDGRKVVPEFDLYGAGGGIVRQEGRTPSGGGEMVRTLLAR